MADPSPTAVQDAICVRLGDTPKLRAHVPAFWAINALRFTAWPAIQAATWIDAIDLELGTLHEQVAATPADRGDDAAAQLTARVDALRILRSSAAAALLQALTLDNSSTNIPVSGMLTRTTVLPVPAAWPPATDPRFGGSPYPWYVDGWPWL